MLTTSPECSARESSSRIVRTSTRAISPSREIWPDAGLTHQAPMRSITAVVRSMEGWLLPSVSNRKRRSPNIPHRRYTPTAASLELRTLLRLCQRRGSVLSELFRVFQTWLKTSRVSPG